MTGELSLGGQVLAVGGLKEKILAAHRAKVTKLILPASVRNTVEKDVPPSVKAGIELVYATNAREVLYEVFKDTHLPAQWKGKFPLEEDYFGIGGLKDAGVEVGGGEPAVDV
jgi:Lon-like ATP-dependent protease